jgi:energy-coupling factor transporter ATP-binding protein EcfA2
MERETQSGKIKPGLSVSIFKPKHDEPVKWESWSGGESQRLRVIGAVALSEVLLRRAGVTCDLIVLDEPTRHLSPEGVGDLVEFLVELGRDHQVFYIDHQVVQSNQFASLITVTRSTSGAKISIER